MRLDISQPPLNTSLMGVVKGVSDFYGLNLKTPVLFGRSGHAFVLNLSRDICPSGPYVWNMDPLVSLLENTGIRMNNLGYFDEKSSLSDRAALEEKLREELAAGNPCSILNMDNQLISGYDESGFNCVQPWECDFPPNHLTFGTWKEIAEEIHACFFSFEQMEMLDPSFCIQRSLLFALDQLQGKPVEAPEGAVSGLEAWDFWVEGIRNGHGEDHGNWWNATVWSECRKMASVYFQEIVEGYPGAVSPAGELAGIHRDISNKLLAVSEKELEKAEKIKLLRQCRTLEEGTVPLLKDLIENIETREDCL